MKNPINIKNAIKTDYIRKRIANTGKTINIKIKKKDYN